MFRITREWLKQFGTPCGTTGFSWNAKQLKAIGIDWPPVKGWTFTVLGKEITDDKKKEFEINRREKGIQAVKVEKGKANMATNPVYHTIPDGKGSWTGHWMSDARWP